MVENGPEDPSSIGITAIPRTRESSRIPPVKASVTRLRGNKFCESGEDASFPRE